MNPTRRKRMTLALVLLAAAAIAGTFIVLALQENLTYLYSPTEVRGGKIPAETRFRLGGVVCTGSVQRVNGTLQVNFQVTDGKTAIPVHFDGILPDMFKEGTSVIATGKMVTAKFSASEVLAKHDETYMPREVAQNMDPALLEKMRRGDVMHKLSCGVH